MDKKKASLGRFTSNGEKEREREKKWRKRRKIREKERKMKKNGKKVKQCKSRQKKNVIKQMVDVIKRPTNYVKYVQPTDNYIRENVKTNGIYGICNRIFTQGMRAGVRARAGTRMIAGVKTGAET